MNFNNQYLQSTMVALILLASGHFRTGAQEAAWLLGGSIGYDRSSNTVLYPSADRETSQSQISIRPYLGKRLNERWIAGLTLGYSFISNNLDLEEDNKTEKTRVQSGSVGVFARYGFNPGHKLLFQIEPSLLFNRGQTTIKVRNDEIYNASNTSFAVGIDPMVSYEMSTKVNLIGRLNGVSYEVGTWTLKGDSAKTNFSVFNGTLNLLGIQIGAEIKF